MDAREVPRDPLADPDLARAAADARARWAEEEEAFAEEAEVAWRHRRTLVDVARECMHRGDLVAVEVAQAVFRGTVVDVSDDCVAVLADAGRVDVRWGPDVVLRVVTRVRAGGRSDGEGRSFRRRLLELEAAGSDVEVGAARTGARWCGRLAVGADHLAVRAADGIETYLPIAGVAWVTVRPAGF